MYVTYIHIHIYIHIHTCIHVYVTCFSSRMLSFVNTCTAYTVSEAQCISTRSTISKTLLVFQVALTSRYLFCSIYSESRFTLLGK